MNDYDEALMAFLEPMVSDRRMELIGAVLARRTRYLTIVLEDIFQPQNASAVLRSCDCFGVQDVHIIENRNRYQLNPKVELGAAKWLTLHRHNDKGHNTADALQQLRKAGYRIVAASPGPGGCPIEKFDLSAGKAAIVLGTELSGLSDEALRLADETLCIPMVGFTESLNISVSAAVILHKLTTELRKSGIPWKLSMQEEKTLRLQWIRNSVNKVKIIEKGFKKGFNQ